MLGFNKTKQHIRQIFQATDRHTRYDNAEVMDPETTDKPQLFEDVHKSFTLIV